MDLGMYREKKERKKIKNEKEVFLLYCPHLFVRWTLLYGRLHLGKTKERTFLLVFHTICTTFACTNMKMKETTRRYYSSWVLLAVFLPMFVLSSLHVHPQAHYEEDYCEECLHHLPHAGHISSQTFCAFDCVLCQFLTLPFLIAAAVVFTAKNPIHIAPHRVENQCVVERERGFVFLRAPPSLIW